MSDEIEKLMLQTVRLGRLGGYMAEEEKDKPIDICVFDFCGYLEPGHFPISMWADWDGEEVTFGGEWVNIPPLKTRKKPTEQQILDHTIKPEARKGGEL